MQHSGVFKELFHRHLLTPQEAFQVEEDRLAFVLVDAFPGRAQEESNRKYSAVVEGFPGARQRKTAKKQVIHNSLLVFSLSPEKKQLNSSPAIFYL